MRRHKIKYDKCWDKSTVVCRINSKWRKHSEIGPAVTYHISGREEYWLFGEHYSKEEWLIGVRKMKLENL